MALLLDLLDHDRAPPAIMWSFRCTCIGRSREGHKLCSEGNFQFGSGSWSIKRDGFRRMRWFCARAVLSVLLAKNYSKCNLCVFLLNCWGSGQGRSCHPHVSAGELFCRTIFLYLFGDVGDLHCYLLFCFNWPAWVQTDNLHRFRFQDNYKAVQLPRSASKFLNTSWANCRTHASEATIFFFKDFRFDFYPIFLANILVLPVLPVFVITKAFCWNGILISFQRMSTCCLVAKLCLFSAKVCKNTTFWLSCRTLLQKCSSQCMLCNRAVCLKVVGDTIFKKSVGRSTHLLLVWF